MAPVLAAALTMFAAAMLAGGVQARPLGLDAAVADAAPAVRTDWLDAIMRALSAGGDGRVATSVALIACAWLTWTGARRQTVVLALAVPLTSVAVTAIKALTDRARPEDGLVATHNAAFPSGHASSSTVYLLVGFLVFTQLRRRGGAGVAALVAGAALTAAIGLSRLYLGVHWTSDVVAGWSLAVAVFAGVTLAEQALPRLAVARTVRPAMSSRARASP